MARIEDGWQNYPPPMAKRGDFAVPVHTNPAPQPQAEEAGSAILEYWQLIKRRKWVIFMTAILGALTAFVLLVLDQPIYGTGTTIELQGFNESFMNLNAVDPEANSGNYSVNKENISTQMRIIESRSVRTPVIDRLRRETAPEVPPNGGTLAPLRSRIFGRQDPLLEMRKGLGMAGGTLRAQPILGTRIIRISCESTLPDIAANFVNAIAAEYIAQNSQQRTISAQKTSQWLESQLEESRVKVEDAEKRLQDFMRTSGGTFVGVDEKGGEKETLADIKMKQLQGELSAMQADRIAKQAKYDHVKSSPPDSLPDVVDDPTYRQYQTKLADLRQELAKLNETLTPANPKVQRVQEQIVELTAAMQQEKDLILQRYRNDYDSVLEHERLLASAYASQVSAVAAQSDKAAQYEQLRREVDLYQGTLNSMLQQVNQAAVVSALPTSNVRVIDSAIVPGLPFKPDAVSYELYGLAGGSASGVVLVLLIATISNWRSSRTFGVPGYSPRLLKVPELGVIPSIAASQRLEEAPVGTRWSRLLPGRSQAPTTPLIGPGSQGSFLAESFHLTLTSILLMSHPGRQPKVIVVTSPGPGEGKTTVVSNLAVAIAESGRKVLIFDADLRRPRIHQVFGIETNEGFAEFIVRSKVNGNGEAKTAPTICQTRIDGLFVLPGGVAGDLNLSHVFHSPEIPVLLDKLSAQFDVVLIDTPPMIQFSDARLIARLSDGLILVVRSGVTERESAVVARGQLVQDNIEVLGTILNDWDARSAGKYQYRQYYSYATSRLRSQKASFSGEKT